MSTTEWWDLPVFCLVDTGFIVAGELTRLDRKLVHSTSAVRGFFQDLLIVNQHKEFCNRGRVLSAAI